METFTISPGERQHLEYLEDLFALITAIEKIEKANLRDLITQEEYDATMRRLLDKYKSTVSYLETGSNPLFTTIDSFWENYCSRCPAARKRIQLGFTSGGKISSPNENVYTVDPQTVLLCGQYFITLMDSLKLQQTAVDQLFPLLTDLINGLRRLDATSKDFFVRLDNWRTKLDGMHASDELNERDTREFAFVLERGYQEFHNFLRENSSGSGQVNGALPPS